MNAAFLCALACAGLALRPGPAELPPGAAQAPWYDSLKPSILQVLENLEWNTPRELVAQKRERNTYQREGYVRVLYSLVTGDAPGALAAYLKMSLHIELTMEHKQFWIIVPDPGRGIPGMPFPDDWSYPADPWKREWWSGG